MLDLSSRSAEICQSPSQGAACGPRAEVPFLGWTMISFTLQSRVAYHPKCASGARFVACATNNKVPVPWDIGLPWGAGRPCFGRTHHERGRYNQPLHDSLPFSFSFLADFKVFGDSSPVLRLAMGHPAQKDSSDLL